MSSTPSDTKPVKTYLLLKFAIENAGDPAGAKRQADEVCNMWSAKDCWADGYELRDAKKAVTVEENGRMKFHYEVWGSHSQEKITALQAKATAAFQKRLQVVEKKLILPPGLAQDGSGTPNDGQGTP